MTETTLSGWRYGQTQAERLVAGLLHVEGFSAVDPQHPLGGPDGLKDVVCTKDGHRWIAACYFPSTSKSFADVRNKFEADFEGVAKNSATGFAFFVNQPLTISERAELQSLASGVQCEIYHLERIRALLDSPKGCGLRLEYLRIPMSAEEQWAFWQAMQVDVVTQLLENEKRRAGALAGVEAKLDLLIARTQSLEHNLTSRPSSVASLPALGNGLAPTGQLTLQLLCWLHRIVIEDMALPFSSAGTFRTIAVWVGVPGSSPETAKYVPPPPDQVVPLLSSWLEEWRARYPSLVGAPKSTVVDALARFHHRFVQIHPFLDANGRVARTLLDQAATELLGRSIGAEFTSDRTAYFEALSAADRGDMSGLIARVNASLK